MAHGATLRHWLVALCLALAPGALAHELWIEPAAFDVKPGERIRASIRIGQLFKGNEHPFLPASYKRLEVSDPVERRAVKGRMGDMPALSIPTTRSGLHVVVDESTHSLLTYETKEKFERFVTNHGLDWVAAAHKKRGLPEAGFVEAYFRYAKSLVKVGDGAGADKPAGMPFELVALTNPYAAEAREGVSFQLLYHGKPFPGAQVHVFQKRGIEEATLTRLATDQQGRVFVPRGAGGVFLVNAVHMIEAPPELAATNAVWTSLWASMTYRLPE